MRRLSFLGLFILFVVIISGVYRVANQYQIKEKQVNQFNAEMEDDHENIRVLQAEWAFLTNPVRLEKIARENFQLQPVDGRQTVAVADIPVRAALDAQQINQDGQTDVAESSPAPKKPVAVAQKTLPPGVSVASNDEQTTIAAALPAAASQALPPLEATPVSAEQVAR
jgi:cell division protein FtsL